MVLEREDLREGRFKGLKAQGFIVICIWK